MQPTAPVGAIRWLAIAPPALLLACALSFAVRKDWPELREVIDIGIRSMGTDERRPLLPRWAPDLAAAERWPHSRPPEPAA